MAVTINGSAGVTTNSGAIYNGLQTGTAVTASGTSIDFTGIPSWAKRVTVMFSEVSTNGTSPYLIQLGSGSVLTSGYTSTGTAIQGTAAGANAATSGFQLSNTDGAATWVKSGAAVFTNVGSNIWQGTSLLSVPIVTRTEHGAGSVTLSGSLDRVRITTLGGTNTFDAGTINIIYE